MSRHILLTGALAVSLLSGCSFQGESHVKASSPGELSAPVAKKNPS